MLDDYQTWLNDCSESGKDPEINLMLYTSTEEMNKCSLRKFPEQLTVFYKSCPEDVDYYVFEYISGIPFTSLYLEVRNYEQEDEAKQLMKDMFIKLPHSVRKIFIRSNIPIEDIDKDNVIFDSIRQSSVTKFTYLYYDQHGKEHSDIPSYIKNAVDTQLDERPSASKRVRSN